MMTSIGPTTRCQATGAAARRCCSRGRRNLAPPQASPSGRPRALPLPAVAGSSMIAVLFSVAMVPRPQELRDQTSQNNRWDKVVVSLVARSAAGELPMPPAGPGAGGESGRDTPMC